MEANIIVLSTKKYGSIVLYLKYMHAARGVFSEVIVEFERDPGYSDFDNNWEKMNL